MNVSKILLTCSQDDCDIKLQKEDRIIAARVNCASFQGVPMSGNAAEPTAKSFVMDRIVELAIARELQINREVDIVEFRNRLKIGENADKRFVGTIAKYRHAEAVEGETVGKDKGYPYKRWRISDTDKAIKLAKQNHWPLMRPVGKTAILARSEA